MPGGTSVQTSVSGAGGGYTGPQATGKKAINYKSIPPWLIAVAVIVPCGLAFVGLWLWLKKKGK